MTINCILIDDEPFARETLEEYISKVPYLNLLDSFDDPLEAMTIINSQTVDLIFSDIQMPEMDGISFLKSLRNPPFIIFITGHPGFAVEGFELDILDYIIKPFSFERFLRSANKAQKTIELNSMNIDDSKKEYFPIFDGHKTFLVKHKDIYCIQGQEDYLRVKTIEKEFMIKKTMKEMENSLPSESFIRIQKSYIVNINYIKFFDAVEVALVVPDHTLPIGLKYRDAFLKKLNIKKTK